MPAYDVGRLNEVRQEFVRSDPNDKDRLDQLDFIFRVVTAGDPGISEDSESPYTHWVVNSAISVCFVCKRECIWVGDEIVYPRLSASAPKPNEDLSADVRRDYTEATAVLSLSPRASCALLRLAIQKMCADVLGREGDINEMIAELVGQGLPTMVQQALDIVRVVGNEAVHPGTLDLRDDASTAGNLFALVNLIAEALITQPKHVASMFAGLPPNKLKGIEARNAKAISAPHTSGDPVSS